MKATEARLLEFLNKSPQFIIPIYQRTYSWTEAECKQLWDDIIRTGKNDAISAHFVGSVVYIKQGLYQVTSQSPLLVIDGQQRLTTVSLILEALARSINDEPPVDGFTPKKLRNYYLLNALEDGDLAYKLLLTQTDKESLIALLEQRDLPKEYSLRIAENFDFFMDRIKKLGKNIDALCKGLLKLIIVDISLDRNQDNPQLIFESMNSTGKELSQADLIRNYILMGVEPDTQTRLYRHYWRPMEKLFGQEAYSNHFDGFMRYYLTIKTGDLPQLRKIYETFKVWSQAPEQQEAGVDAILADIQTFAKYYCAIALKQEENKLLAQAFDDINEMKVDVSYPFLMELYDDYEHDLLNAEEFERAIRLVESFVFRRAISGIPTNSLNKTFSTFSKHLNKDRYLESIEAHFQLLKSYRRFPNDDEFHREILTRNLYNFPRRHYWLRRMENHDRKEPVLVHEYSVEHIMPQNENLSESWKKELGEDWRQIHEKWLHTLGNLTLTGYNSEYGDRPFKEKRDMKGGFKESPLRLNAGLSATEVWDESAIKARAEKLAELAKQVWISPKRPDSVLDEYRKKSTGPSSYSIDTHAHLSLNALMRPLFDVLRKEITALDSCVSEEFLKHYVAYKAETNFVDIIPQAGALQLSLNIPFLDLHDPRELVIDVAGRGRWGNGDSEVKLSRKEEIPYILGLIRQALVRQLDNSDLS